MHHLWEILIDALDLPIPSRQRGKKLSQMEEMQRAMGIVLLIVFGFILLVGGIIWLGSALSHP